MVPLLDKEGMPHDFQLHRSLPEENQHNMAHLAVEEKAGGDGDVNTSV